MTAMTAVPETSEVAEVEDQASDDLRKREVLKGKEFIVSSSDRNIRSREITSMLEELGLRHLARVFVVEAYGGKPVPRVYSNGQWHNGDKIYPVLNELRQQFA